MVHFVDFLRSTNFTSIDVYQAAAGYKYIGISTPSGNMFVGFSKKLGELDIKTLKARRDSLGISEYNDRYYLCEYVESTAMSSDEFLA